MIAQKVLNFILKEEPERFCYGNTLPLLLKLEKVLKLSVLISL